MTGGATYFAGWSSADVAVVLVLSPNRPQPCFQHPHEADVVDRSLAIVTGLGLALDDPVLPAHDGRCRGEYRSWLSQLPMLGPRMSHR
jgi:hypothetical protein